MLPQHSTAALSQDERQLPADYALVKATQPTGAAGPGTTGVSWPGQHVASANISQAAKFSSSMKGPAGPQWTGPAALHGGTMHCTNCLSCGIQQ